MPCFHHRGVDRYAVVAGAAVCLGAVCLGIVLAGCDRKTESDVSTAPQAKPSPMRVVVVADEPFAAVLERQWKARLENELELQQMSIAEVESARQLQADLLFFPSACLGTLVEHDLLAVPSPEALSDDQYAPRDLFEIQRRVEVRWGQQLYAFSFGSPHLVLMYRADLFDQLKLPVPRTWSEYATLLPRLARDQLGAAAPSADRPWTATIEPLSEGWGAKVLLARAAAYAAHPSQFSTLFDYETMQPLIAGPPFVRALDELVAVAQTSPEDFGQYTPEAARRAFLAGASGMVLSWPSRATTDNQPLPLAVGVQAGFAELPGSDTVYNFGEQVWTPCDDDKTSRHVPLTALAGRLAAVGKDVRRPREAAGILALLSGPEWSARISALSPATTLFRQSHVRSPELWTDEALPREASVRYAEVARDSQSQPSSMASLRIPGWQRYLAALDQAVHDARTGAKSTADALQDAVTAWDAITRELGVDTQKAAYMRSLGLEP
ncbi:MAG: extracellular solute-binding protein [Planctomycetaceae bacterium]|nr:extracellular solute-binding protein [Planctomycetaceae bacterium]